MDSKSNVLIPAVRRFTLRAGLVFGLFVLVMACGGDDGPENTTDEYKQKMRAFVQGISVYTRSIKTNFIIIPQNGQELVTTNGQEDGPAATEYLNAIDGVGREDLFYGYAADDEATPASDVQYMSAFLDVCEANEVEVLTTDYCSTHSKMDDSYSRNSTKGYISFAAPERELNVIPNYPATPFNENENDILTLKDAKNFLYLLNTEKFATKEILIDALSQTNYDIIIMDLFFEKVAFTSSEVGQLKVKKNGGTRLVICYMSIGEAEDYRYYWNNQWTVGNPAWLSNENPDWPGNYKVKYWEKEWQDIIYGTDNSYAKKIMNAGFDGVYLDIIDAFEYFE
jgi:cysteinyl-tRNA synthetase, unknown class